MKIIPNFNGKTGIVPRTCAVTNRGADPEGFIDTHNVLTGWDREVYISIAAAKEMGRMVGMYTAEDVDALRERVETLSEELAQALEQLSDFIAYQDLQQKLAEKVTA